MVIAMLGFKSIRDFIEHSRKMKSIQIGPTTFVNGNNTYIGIFDDRDYIGRSFDDYVNIGGPNRFEDEILKRLNKRR